MALECRANRDAKRGKLMAKGMTLILFATTVGCTTNAVPYVAREPFEGATNLELLSIDSRRPTEPPVNGFHGWNVLGTTSMKDQDSRDELISSFKRGVAESDGSVAMCFNPRHGMSITHNGSTYDYVICFECSQVKWYVDGKEQETILITDSPKPTFDRALERANIPLAEPAD